MSLQKASEEILEQLVQLIDLLDEHQYDAKMEIMSNSSVGKHVRHIIEFYECLLNGLDGGVVDYDARVRNTLLETDPFFAVQVILDMTRRIHTIKEDRMLRLKLNLSVDNGMQEEIDTTVFRELAYNIEHAIHHMAIIKMAVQSQYPKVHVSENFGVAYSTLRYAQQVQHTS